jgi:hypothetical protein
MHTNVTDAANDVFSSIHIYKHLQTLFTVQNLPLVHAKFSSNLSGPKKTAYEDDMADAVLAGRVKELGSKGMVGVGAGGKLPSPTQTRSFEAFVEGKRVAEIAKERDIKESTVQ